MKESEYLERLGRLLDQLADAKAEGNEEAVVHIQQSIKRLDRIARTDLEAEVQREIEIARRYRPDGSPIQHHQVWPMRPYFSPRRKGR